MQPCLRTEADGQRHRGAWRDRKTEKNGMQWQRQGCGGDSVSQQLLAMLETKRTAWSSSSHNVLRENVALPTPWFWTCSLLNYAMIHFCCSIHFFPSSPKKLKQFQKARFSRHAGTLTFLAFQKACALRRPGCLWVWWCRAVTLALRKPGFKTSLRYTGSK